MNLQIIFQLFLAAILGGLIGLEREYKGKRAGLQTYSLVTLGTCLFTLVAFEIFNAFSIKIYYGLDVLTIIPAIALGIGFIGAGVISHHEKGTQGLTTAAGLWVVAAIGVAVGANFCFLAFFATFLTVLILAGLGLIEEKFFKVKD
jgi:putative Mg2+ transporter-C (MgtC) family protein